MTQRLKRRPDRLLVLAQRARRFAGDEHSLLADLYREHAAICESKAAAQAKPGRKSRQATKPSES